MLPSAVLFPGQLALLYRDAREGVGTWGVGAGRLVPGLLHTSTKTLLDRELSLQPLEAREE